MKSRFPFFAWRHIAITLLALLVTTLVIRIRWIDTHADDAVAEAPAPILTPTPAPPVPTSQPPMQADADNPADVPPEEWARLKKTLGATAEGRQQLQQAGQYLSFKHRAENWEALQAQGVHSAEKTRLAQQLLDDLPQHVGRGEVTGFEARALEAQLLEDTEPGANQRQQAMVAETARITAAEPQTDPQAAVKMAAYKQQEASITAQWLAMAPSARDPKWLESQLDAARRQAFDGEGATQTQ